MRWATTRPWDLIAVSGLCVITDLLVGLGGSGALRIVLGLALVLFAPGYALVAALFPERYREGEVATGEGGAGARRRWERGIGGLERVALSFGLSIAVVPLLGLGLNFTPWGIHLAPILVVLSLFTLACCGAAAWRRARLPEEERLLLVVELEAPAWREASPLDRVLTIALAIAVVAAAGALGYVLLTPRQGESFTEFYILGPSGKAEGYPTNLSVGEDGRLIVGVVNHEHANLTYSLTIVAQAGAFVNQSGNETFQSVGNTTLSAWNVTLRDGETWEENRTFALPQAGAYRVVFLLDQPREAASPYRELHLYVRVKG